MRIYDCQARFNLKTNRNSKSCLKNSGMAMCVQGNYNVNGGKSGRNDMERGGKAQRFPEQGISLFQNNHPAGDSGKHKIASSPDISPSAT